MASVRLAGLCLVTASLVVSAPVLVFTGLVLDYFYHARSFVIVTSWSWVTWSGTQTTDLISSDILLNTTSI